MPRLFTFLGLFSSFMLISVPNLIINDDLQFILHHAESRGYMAWPDSQSNLLSQHIWSHSLVDVGASGIKSYQVE